jgi:hypothetical protein
MMAHNFQGTFWNFSGLKGWDLSAQGEALGKKITLNYRALKGCNQLFSK